MFERFKHHTVYEASADNAAGSGEPAPEKTDDQQALEYDSWLNEQPEPVKAMLATWSSGLKTALKSERDARAELQKQLRELAPKAEKGSELEQQLTTLADTMAESDRKAGFYEAAHAAGVSNLKLAYLVAVQEDLFDKKGAVNFEAMRAGYPELFAGKTKPAPGNAGNGTNQDPTGAQDMNNYIRAATGRK